MATDLATYREQSIALTEIKVRKEIAETAGQMLADAVTRAREADTPWQLIADALGVRRQSAMARYGK